MKYGIEMVSSWDGTFEFNEGVWLKTYDPDANEGRGGFEVTTDPSEALAWGSKADAATESLRISTERPCDNEGNLNRPLHDKFAFAIRELPEAVAA